MIPILYEKTETSFTSNGICRLVDCISCTVTEGRNDIYECEFEYPITGKHYADIQEGRIIAVTHDNTGDIQPFDIYHRTAPINGIVTFNARHISYRQIGITVTPFSASGVANAIAGLKTNSYGTNPFTYWTNKTTSGDYVLSVPGSLKSLLGGQENSLLDAFGTGEYEWDKFAVKLWAARGTDTDVEIRYGKNMSDIKHDLDYSDSYNGVVPYWYGTFTNEYEQEEEKLVMLPEVAIMADGTTYDGRDTVLPLDLSSDFQEPPTEADLRAQATYAISLNNTLLPIENIKISFVQLWQTEEYKNIAPLQAVGLCDTVNVVFPELGIDGIRVKVIETKYDALLDRYEEMTLGDSLPSYASLINANNTSSIANLEDGLQRVLSLANQANIYATDAQQSSTTASSYANAALDQLSIVESVVGVLDLLSNNAVYQLTSDITVTPGKWYFTQSGTSPDYVYTVVTNPVDSDIATYYEIVSIDAAVQNYIISKLAVTSEGLWVKSDSDTKILLSSTDGVVLYGPDGKVTASYGSDTIIGDSSGFHIKITGTEIGFYVGENNRVAYMNGSQLYVANSLSFGNFIFMQRANGHFTLKLIT